MTHLLGDLIQWVGLGGVADWLRLQPLPMPTLGQPWWLLVLLLPALIGLWRWRRRQRLLDYAEPHLRRWALTGSDAGGGRQLWSQLGWAVAWVLLAVALADPRVPRPTAAAHGSPAPVMVVLDTSAAMTVRDVSPNRAARARALVDLLAKRLPGVPLGLMVYADRAGLLLPPTTDRGLLRYFVSQSAGLITHTNAPRPDKAFERIARMPAMAHGAVVWLTSGDDRSYSGPLSTRQLAAAQKLAKRGIPLFALVEAGAGGVMREDGMAMTDIQGNVQRSQPDARRVTELARLGTGAARTTTTLPADADFLARHIRRLPPLPLTGTLGKRTVSIHQLPLLLATLLLVVLLLADMRRARGLARRGRSGLPALLVAWPVAAVLATSLAGWPHGAQAAESSAGGDDAEQASNQAAIRAGQVALAAGDYARAQVDFGPAKGFAARFGSGVSGYRRGDYAFAIGQFQQALWLASSQRQRLLTLFNLGDALVLGGRYQAALDAFDAFLAVAPDNAAAKKNRVIVATLLEKQASNRKDERHYKGHQNATYGYYHEPRQSKMDDRMLESHGATSGPAGGQGSGGKSAAPFQLTPDLAGSARRKLDLIHDRPAPLLRALIDQQIYTLPPAGGKRP